MVLHLWDGRTSDTAFHNNLHHYAALDQIAHNYDIDLCVGKRGMHHRPPDQTFCALRQHYPKIHFVFDTKMAAFHQQLELLYEKEYEWLWKHEHIRHYHLPTIMREDCFLFDAKKAAGRIIMKIQIRTASIHDFPAVDAIMRHIQQLHIDWRPDIYRQSATVLPIEVYEQAVRDQTFCRRI